MAALSGTARGRVRRHLAAPCRWGVRACKVRRMGRGEHEKTAAWVRRRSVRKCALSEARPPPFDLFAAFATPSPPSLPRALLRTAQWLRFVRTWCTGVAVARVLGWVGGLFWVFDGRGQRSRGEAMCVAEGVAGCSLLRSAGRGVCGGVACLRQSVRRKGDGAPPSAHR